MTNKVLVGEKLQPIQAAVLFVDDEYITTDQQKLGEGKAKSKAVKSKAPGKSGNALITKAPAKSPAAEPELPPEQRRTVRNRLIIWAIIGAVGGAVVGMFMWYYSTWVWHNVNQNLRVAMAERAESLSLRYHDNHRIGDAMFRVYQDSAQIVNLLQELQSRLSLTYLFVAHDLSVVKHISDRVAVMYLGKIVEITTSDQLYSSPQHPYTQALMSAVPIPQPSRERRRTILTGDVPSPPNIPKGCPFHPRCPEREDACTRIVPDLLRIEDGHNVACLLRPGQKE